MERATPGPVRICTVGHGARSISGLLEILVTAGVDTLVDVRRSPGSRRPPRRPGLPSGHTTS